MKKKVYIISLIGFLLDQISKVIITSNINLNDSIVIIKDFFSFRYIRNTGAAWGIMSNSTVIISIISCCFLFLIIRYIEKEKISSFVTNLSFGFVIGGIAGNLIDRLFRGYVIDFFSFRIFNYNFPVFNVADILIVIGAILLIISLGLGDENDERRKKEA